MTKGRERVIEKKKKEDSKGEHADIIFQLMRKWLKKYKAKTPANLYKQRTKDGLKNCKVHMQRYHAKEAAC